MRTIVMVLIAIILFLVQGVVLPSLLGRPWIPDLVLVLIVIFATFHHKRWALWTTILGGLLQDIVISDFFGLHFFPYLLVYYVTSRWAPRVYKEQWYITVLTVILASLLDQVSRLIILALTGASVSLPAYVWYFTLPEVLSQACIGWLFHKLTYQTTVQDTYRW